MHRKPPNFHHQATKYFKKHWLVTTSIFFGRLRFIPQVETCAAKGTVTSTSNGDELYNVTRKITLYKSKFVLRFVYISDIFRVDVNTVHMTILAHLRRFDDIFTSCALMLRNFQRILFGQIHDVQAIKPKWIAGF